MSINQFKLNANKTHILTVGTAERLATLDSEVEVTMDGLKLVEAEEKSELLLGCQLEKNLKWHRQIAELVKRLKKRLVGLQVLKYILPYDTRKSLTTGIFNSVLVYCLPLFGGCDIGEIKQLQVIQNKAAQVVTHSPPRANRDTMFDKLQWLSVNQLISSQAISTV